MSQSKFARVTASLLVRKGDAEPSDIAPSRFHWMDMLPRVVSAAAEFKKASAQELPPIVGRQEKPEAKFVYRDVVHDLLQCGEAKAEHPEKPRRIVLTLTPQEYETLGLVAVKKGATRHQLAQEAMDAYFEWLVSEFGEACACIVGGALCRCECGTKHS